MINVIIVIFCVICIIGINVVSLIDMKYNWNKVGIDRDIIRKNIINRCWISLVLSVIIAIMCILLLINKNKVRTMFSF